MTPISCPLQTPSGLYIHAKATLNMKRVLAPSLWSLVTGTMVVMRGVPLGHMNLQKGVLVGHSECLVTVPRVLSVGSTHLVVHLLGAVEDVHHGAQGSAQVLGCLSLACASRASRGSTHNQMERLREGDVAPAKDPQSPVAL